MEVSKKLYFLKISFVPFFLLLFPFISFAQWLPTGPACSPEDDFNPTHTQTCQYKKVGTDKPREVRLKWNITPKGSGPQFCALGCTQSGGTSCTGAMFKDNNGFAAGAPGSKLYAKDDIKINDKSLEVGNTYQTFCCSLKDPSQRTGGFLDRLIDFCQDNTLSSSQKMVIGNSVPCELSFRSIADSLSGEKATHITEQNMRRWALTDDLDYKDAIGSGDVRDLTAEIVNRQDTGSCAGSSTSIPNPGDFEETQAVIRELKKRIKNPDNPNLKDVVEIGISNYERDIHHAEIALELIDNGDSYAIKILDPNGPKISSITCPKTEFSDCKQASSYTGNVYDFQISLTGLRDQDSTRIKRKQLRTVECSKTIGRPTDEFCNRNFAKWLEENYPNIDNPADESSRGSCWGWSDFMISVAYLGDFVGYDYHPNDGKVIRTDCDEITRYPLSRKSSSAHPQNWLANAWSAWYNIFK